MAFFLLKIVSLLAALHLVQARVQPVDQLDLGAFTGRWYQTHGSLSVKYLTELGANCVYVEYGTMKDSSAVTVLNSVSVLGRRVNVGGFATPSPNEVGVFQVALGPPGHPAPKPAPFTKANYVVIDLGPKVDGKYDYAVVTDPSMLSLYVLARDAGRFKEKYRDDALQKISQMGFNTFYNKPLETNQEGCRYPSESSEFLEAILV
eukprot:TRINITY_DN31914_c0_g1_i2.p1 TRINITY_DN31914_c0_g1~~TRINITY_DN31914_c0_g1_i2.p1  ORF type:complete len:205 (-),score=29.54 TRINITY_DN31914_c0_g1_i2:99-713(-)